MAGAKYCFALFIVLLVCAVLPTQGKGGRGGGGRGGGSRGSGSSGSRGSSSSGSRGSSSSSSSSSHGSSSSSRGSSSSGTQWEHSSSSSSNKPSPPKHIDLPKPAQPSAPELPKVNPSAPRLPQSPGHSQPSNPHPYNPNYAQQAKPQSEPSYGKAPPGNPPSYSPRENPPSYSPRENPPPYSPGHGPPYAPGNPPPYSPGHGPPYAPGNPPPYSPGHGPPYAPGNPPPYSPGHGPPYAPGNPPPYSPGHGPPYAPGNPPPYAPGHGPPYAPGNPPPYAPGNPPPYGPPSYGTNTGNFPQGPTYGQPPYGGANRPNFPQGNLPPYGGSPVQSGHGIQTGNIPPHGSQPSNFPYPRQPGISYPPGGSGWPNYYSPGGFQGNPSIKPHKKKGILGGLFSIGKKPKHHGIGSPVGSFGGPSIGGHGISPVHMILPAAALMKKSHKPFHFKPHFWVLPYVAYRSTKWGGFDLDYDDDDDYYRRRCFRPRAPIGGSISCVRTLQKLDCRATCQEGYRFPDNSTELEAHCWRFSGHWSRSRFLPRCQPYCKQEECQNGGSCTAPGQCQCSSEYRGNHCEYPVMNCDILKFSRGSKISWVCSHSRNETLCRVRCRPPLVFETPTAEKYHCHLNGTWTPDRIPQCIEETLTTEGTQNTTLHTKIPQEG